MVMTKIFSVMLIASIICLFIQFAVMVFSGIYWMTRDEIIDNSKTDQINSLYILNLCVCVLTQIYSNSNESIQEV